MNKDGSGEAETREQSRTMDDEQKEFQALTDNGRSMSGTIPFQIEADMRKGPPSSAVIRLHGAIDARQNRLIDRIIGPLLKAKVKYVIVDFSDVPTIEAMPVQCLVDYAKGRSTSSGQHPFSLTGLRPAVVEAIKGVKPGKVFVVYKYFQDAVKSLKLKGFPDLYLAGTRPTGLNMRVMVKVIPRGVRVALVTPYGYIQQPEAELLGKILRRVSLMEVQNVVVDLSGISYANSHALGSVLNCATAWQKVFGRKAVGLAGAKPGIKLVLTTLGIARSAFVCDTVDEALRRLEEEEKRVASGPAEVPVEKEKPVEAREEEIAEHLEKRMQEHAEETSFAMLASDESADTDTWILKNVQSILRKEAKEYSNEEAGAKGKKEKGKGKDKKQQEKEAGSKESKKSTSKSTTKKSRARKKNQ